MKTVRAIYLLGLCLGHTACGGAHFDVLSAGQAQLAAGDVPGTLVLSGMNPYVISKTTILKAQGIGTERISKAYVTEAALTVAKPGGGVDLAFLNDASVQIQASGLPTLTLGTTSTFPAQQNLVLLTVPKNQDIGRYLRAKSCTIGLTLSGSPSPADIALRLDLQVSLDVDNQAVLFE